MNTEKTTYTFPSIFEYLEEEIGIKFPDLEEACTCADNEQEGLKMAQEVLALTLVGREKDNEDIPEPTSLKDLECESNEKTVLISVYMPYARSSVKNVHVKKTLTIPAWLNVLGEQNKINFSQLLQEALKSALNVK